MQDKSEYNFKPIAHVLPEDSQVTHDLAKHLSAVSEIAGRMASDFGAEEWGRIAGLWHDLGKFSRDFQLYIRNRSGHEAHFANAASGRVNHSSAGALQSEAAFGTLGMVLAYLISGHHAGLPDWYASETGNAALENRLREGRAEGLLQLALEAVPKRVLMVERPALKPDSFGGPDGLHLWIRMLFSCLTDADFLDTEAFMDKARNQQRGGYSTLATLRTQFGKAMKKKARDAGVTPVNQLRADVLRQCRARGAAPPGLYTLTVPTGGGKTLSSLAFALEHALHHCKRRIIYAIPYTSIIEQTANTFRDIFGDAVLEHHSNLDVKQETVKGRLASENWDAPLIVTTNVQFFESLFAARTSRCRKLHNLVNSVVILDEAQLLPPEFLQPILDVMRLLTDHFGVTFVLCTATQPALGTRTDSFGKTWLRGPGDAREIVSCTEQLYKQLDRVKVTLPKNWTTRDNWDEIAARIAQHPSVLAIVNSRADCRELHRRMPAGTIHLSALMCGEHRSFIIGRIKQMLADKESVRVISTQLIEAGVDVDFPVVYRALAGLDSIAQAAGRCNREGSQVDKGNVVIFIPPDRAPRGLLRFGEDVCRKLLIDSPENPLSPEMFMRYFEHYYSKAGNEGLDKNGIHDLLTKDAAQCHIQFRTAAERFRLIDEDGSVAVIVPYCNPKEPERNSRSLIARLRSGELHRGLLRELQRYTVTVRLRHFQHLEKSGELEEVVQGIWVLTNDTAYHPDLGLLQDETGNPDPSGLYC